MDGEGPPGGGVVRGVARLELPGPICRLVGGWRDLIRTWHGAKAAEAASPPPHMDMSAAVSAVMSPPTSTLLPLPRMAAVPWLLCAEAKAAEAAAAGRAVRKPSPTPLAASAPKPPSVPSCRLGTGGVGVARGGGRVELTLGAVYL